MAVHDRTRLTGLVALLNIRRQEAVSWQKIPAVQKQRGVLFGAYGKEFTEETEKQLLELLRPDYIDGLSLLGGEPFEPENQEVLTELLRKVKKLYPEKTVWCYSGYLFDKELLNPSRARCGYTDEMLSRIDVLVDGRFVETLKDIRLVFRGSSNQRIIDVKQSLETGEIRLWTPKIRRGISPETEK